jgi:hypothetical protein
VSIGPPFDQHLLSDPPKSGQVQLRFAHKILLLLIYKISLLRPSKFEVIPITVFFSIITVMHVNTVEIGLRLGSALMNPSDLTPKYREKEDGGDAEKRCSGYL